MFFRKSIFLLISLFLLNTIYAQESLKKVLDGEAHALYEYGSIISAKNPLKAESLLTLSALQNNYNAQKFLISLDGIDNDFKNYLQQRVSSSSSSENNIDDLNKLGLAGDSFAQYQLWLLYINGELITKPKAYVWLKKAAGNKYPDALYSLGLLYYYGFIVPEQRSKALKLLQESTELGSSNAQFFLENLEKFKHLNKSLIDIVG